MLSAVLAILGKLEFFLEFFLVALRIMRNPITLAASKFHDPFFKPYFRRHTLSFKYLNM